MKLCVKCDEWKDRSAFYAARGTKDGLRGECKACFAARAKAHYVKNKAAEVERVRRWRAANPEKYREYQARTRQSGTKALADRRGHLKRKFNLTPEQYDELLAAQNGRCAICETAPPSGTSLDVDHDHPTGKVRGLLCRNCNQGVGKFRDDPFVMTAAQAYLWNWDREVPDRVRLVLGG